MGNIILVLDRSEVPHSGLLPQSGLSSRIINWFKDLPSAPKLILVGIVLLLLFTVLSPLSLIAAALLLGVSVVIIIFRVRERRAVKGWGQGRVDLESPLYQGYTSPVLSRKIREDG